MTYLTTARTRLRTLWLFLLCHSAYVRALRHEFEGLITNCGRCRGYGYLVLPSGGRITCPHCGRWRDLLKGRY